MDFNINLRSILLLIAMLQGLVIAGLLLQRGLRRRQTADFFLSGLLFYLSCSLIEHFIGFMGVYDYAREQGNDLTFFPFGNEFTFGPLILLYTRALTDGSFRWTRRDWGHFALPVLNYILHFSIWAMPDAAKFQFLDADLAGRIIVIGLQVVFYLTATWYLWQSFQRFYRYRELIEQEYANIGKITLDWLRLFLLAFAAYLALDLLFSVLDTVFDLNYMGWYWLNLIRAFMLYYISVTGWAFAQKSSVHYDALEKRVSSSNQQINPSSNQQLLKLAFSPAEIAIRRTQLAAFMETQKPWLDPEVTLSSLAEQLGLNTSQMSFLVNNAFDQNFNDFVNAYRVEEVKRKLASPDFQHLSLLGIAYESGFNSKATFNRAFKKLTGNAPSQFKGVI
jgi:AraC-like DNA-binding protein